MSVKNANENQVLTEIVSFFIVNTFVNFRYGSKTSTKSKMELFMKSFWFSKKLFEKVFKAALFLVFLPLFFPFSNKNLLF